MDLSGFELLFGGARRAALAALPNEERLGTFWIRHPRGIAKQLISVHETRWAILTENSHVRSSSHSAKLGGSRPAITERKRRSNSPSCDRIRWRRATLRFGTQVAGRVLSRPCVGNRRATRIDASSSYKERRLLFGDHRRCTPHPVARLIQCTRLHGFPHNERSEDCVKVAPLCHCVIAASVRTSSRQIAGFVATLLQGGAKIARIRLGPLNPPACAAPNEPKRSR